MPSHSARILSALTLFAPMSLVAQDVEYAQGTTRYRISTNTNVVSSNPMGTQTYDVGVRQQITVSVMKHAKDTLIANLTVDSISITSTAPAAADVSTLLGSTFVSRISPTGKFFSSKSPDGLDAQLRGNPVYRATGGHGAGHPGEPLGIARCKMGIGSQQRQ